MHIHPRVYRPDFRYDHLVANEKPGICPKEETLTKQCRRCEAEFVTHSRIRKRCDACSAIVKAEKQKKANERLKARRAAKRLAEGRDSMRKVDSYGPRLVTSSQGTKIKE